MPRYKNINGVKIQYTAEEEAARDIEEKAWADAVKDRKLERIRQIRSIKLQETDYMANSDYTMPDDVKTWRQAMRDIPANYKTETEYDKLLATDENGNLTHSVWSK